MDTISLLQETELFIRKLTEILKASSRKRLSSLHTDIYGLARAFMSTRSTGWMPES